LGSVPKGCASFSWPVVVKCRRLGGGLRGVTTRNGGGNGEDQAMGLRPVSGALIFSVTSLINAARVAKSVKYRLS